LWADQLNPQGLSQGDILVDVPVGSTKVPLTYLASSGYTDKRQRTVWTQYDDLQPMANEPSGHWIMKGRVTRALVVTHSCDLDDVQDSERILVAPVWEATQVSDPEHRQRIVQGRRATFVGLPGVPGVGDCYADLRSICPLDRHLFSAAQRHCSMTDDAVLQFQAHIALYFTRIEPQYMAKALQEQMFAEAPNANEEEQK
jgi:hypothetical protein